MSVEEAYNPAVDARSSAYLAILEIRDLLHAEGLGAEGEPLIEALVRLVQRTGPQGASGLARPWSPGPGWRPVVAPCHG